MAEIPKRKSALAEFSFGNFFAGTQVVVGIAMVVPVDVQLVVVPVHVRHVAIGIARTRFFARLHPFHR